LGLSLYCNFRKSDKLSIRDTLVKLKASGED